MLYNYGFTINLTDDYEGGDFVLQTEVGEIAYNIGKGQIVIFPIIYPHKVSPIISGCRQNIIGWFESNITYEQSFILKNLEEIATTNLELLQNNTEQILFKELLIKTALVQNYLVTKWGF